VIQLAAPWALLALLALPAIVALHLLRPRRRTVAVSATSLWREALRERQRGWGFERLLRSASLLLLLLAALAASLALAAPQWVAPAGGEEELVLVLDASASMQTRSRSGTRFDEALAEARALLDALGEGGRALVMTSAREAVLRSGFESDRDRLRSVLDGLRAGDEAGRPGEALALALSLLSDRERARVVFVTDGAFDPGAVPDSPQIHYRLVGGPARNVAITGFDLRPERGREDRFQVLLAVRSFVSEPMSVPVSITLERRTLLRRTLELEAHGRETLVLPFEGSPVGRARARLEVGDDLAADDQAFAVIDVPERTHVLLASPGNRYLDSILDALPQVEVERVAALGGADLERLAARHDVVIVDRIALPRLPPGSWLLLDALPPGLPFAGEGRAERPRVQGQGHSALVADLDLAGLRVDEARRVARPPPAPGLQRLLWAEDTELALALLERERRVVYLGFDLARSELPLRAAFPLFVARALEWLAGGDAAGAGAHRRTSLAAGEPVLLRGPSHHGDAIVRRPDGSGVTLRLAGGDAIFDDTSRAGIYRYSIGEVARHFAVNLTDEAESNPVPRLTREDTAAPAPAPPAASVATPLWPHLALACVVLLLAEWLLWCAGPRRA